MGNNVSCAGRSIFNITFNGKGESEQSYNKAPEILYNPLRCFNFTLLHFIFKVLQKFSKSRTTVLYSICVVRALFEECNVWWGVGTFSTFPIFHSLSLTLSLLLQSFYNFTSGVVELQFFTNTQRERLPSSSKAYIFN